MLAIDTYTKYNLRTDQRHRGEMSGYAKKQEETSGRKCPGGNVLHPGHHSLS